MKVEEGKFSKNERGGGRLYLLHPEVGNLRVKGFTATKTRGYTMKTGG